MKTIAIFILICAVCFVALTAGDWLIDGDDDDSDDDDSDTTD